jgi:hypothetical protein
MPGRSNQNRLDETFYSIFILQPIYVLRIAKVTLCDLGGGLRRFEGSCSLYFQAKSAEPGLNIMF